MNRTYKSIGAAILFSAMLPAHVTWAAPAVPAPGESIPEAPAKEESPLSSDLESESPQRGTWPARRHHGALYQGNT